MPTQNAPLWGLVAVLAAAVAFLTFVVLRRRPPAATSDPTLPLIQQEVARLAEKMAQIGAQIPHDVGTSLTQLMGQMGNRLSENAQALQKATADTGRLMHDISHRLGELGKSSQQILELGQDIRGLQQIFQAPKIRGGLGEMALESLLRQFFPVEHFVIQYAFSNNEKVDAVVRLPGGLVPIDSKFPLAGFRAVIDAVGPEQQQKARRAFAREVRKHIDDIAAKYIRPVEGTLDFALMYVPAENVFYEMLVRPETGDEDDLSAYAMLRRVMPVSPNSFYAYLQAIALGLMGLKIERQARDMVHRLRQLSGDFEAFRAKFDLGQKHLKNSQDAFTEAGERAARLGTKIDQVVALEEPVTAAALPVPARELQH